MNKRILFFIGFTLILAGALLTVLFDLPPIITSTITLSGVGIIVITVARSIPTQDIEND